jgi:hypothetical protein
MADQKMTLTQQVESEFGIDAAELDENDCLLWLTREVWRGWVVKFSATTNGDVGVFVNDEPHARGSGDTATEAIEDAMQREASDVR